MTVSLTGSPKSPPASSSPPPSQPSAAAPAPLSMLSELPDDLFVLVFSFLPADEVARAALVSRDVRLRAALPQLWQPLFLADFDLAAGDTAVLQLNPRRCYAQRAAARRQRLQQLARVEKGVRAARRQLATHRLEDGAGLEGVHGGHCAVGGAGRGVGLR